MKKLAFFFLIICTVVKGQDSELWGMADVAGGGTQGIIFKTNLDGSGYTIVDTLKGLNGGAAPGSIIRSRNGKLYGMTLNGGSANYGIVFCYDVFTSTFTKIVDFTGSNGKLPFGSLIETKNGKLYGMTQSGGSYNKGTIFCIDQNDNSFTKLYNLTIITGAIPAGNLFEASNGLLYGMTSSGGVYGFGTVFSFNTANSTFTKLHSFNGTDGKAPLGGLAEGGNGKLYGMTNLGGAFTKGAVFTIDISGANYSVIHNFNGTTGQQPMASFILASNGRLYGMTANGGTHNSGVIFSIDPSGNSFRKEYDFNGGATPNGSLIEASDKKFYGTTENGGYYNKGTIFSFDPDTRHFTDIYDFSSSSYGYEPTGDVLEVKPVKVTAPNFFSPNGDGVNDEYFIITYGVTELSCEIYNRWGQRIHYFTNAQGIWNGKLDNGDAADDGTYYYIVRAKSYDGDKRTLEGNFLLLK